ncbi:MAG: winged helix-turn-helix transcriptional regulator [Thermoplasmata archaeon]|nr:MAG: winged helix-turn-helix transcriptional regulator [Thermoplasmata archaeon]
MVAWDPDGNDQIQEVWVKIDSGELRNATYNHTDAEGQWWYYEWDTTEVEDGWHHITAITYDGTDDASDVIEVIVDNVPENNPPGIAIVEPDGGSTLSGTITIWMVAWDPDGNDQIQEVWVKIDGEELRNATYNHTDAEGQWWYYEWDTTEVEDGWHHITAITYDGTDDASDVIEVIVDNVPENNPPGIAIVEPDGGSTLSGTVTIWMVAWDPDGNDQIQEVWVKIDGGELRNATYNHTNAEGQWWYYEWDTTEVEDGWHHITAITYDGTDDASDVIEVIVDNVPENNPPGIAIVEPDGGSTLSGTITIWMVAWDEDGNDDIDEVWVRIDDGELRNATYNHTDAEGQWWYYEWDTTEVEDGWHHIRAIVYDGKDDGHDVIEVIVDNVPENNPPGIAIVEPDHGSTVSGTITIWMVAWDPDGNDQIQEVWVRIDSGELRNATYNHTNGEGQWWYYEWDTTEVEDGWHGITAITYDGTDDASDTIEVLVDNVQENHPPGITIVEPDGGSTVSGTITIWMVAWDEDGNDDIEEVWVKIDNGELRNATYNHTNGEGQWWYYEWDTTEVEDGWHHIRAIVYDGKDDGHDVIEVLVDNVEENHAPGIEIVEPGHGSTVSGTIVIWMVAWDEDGNDDIENVWVRIDSGELRNATYNHTNGEGQWWYYEWDTTEVEDGWHDITAIVYDGQDDGHDVIEVLVDNEEENHPPGIAIVEPEDGATVGGLVNIWICAWDPDDNEEIQQVWVKIDGGDWDEATFVEIDDEGSWWVYEWDTTSEENGWHHIYAKTTDGEYWADDVIEVYVDNDSEENHAPQIKIMEPDHGATVSGTIVIWMLAWDPDGLDDIENVWVRIDGGHLRNATYNHTDAEGQWWYYEWDTTEVDDGWHSIRASVYDGEDDGHDIIEIIVDNEGENHAPGIEIIEPEDGATVSGTIVIWMVAWDEDGNDDIENVWVRIDGGHLREATYDHTDSEGQWWYYEWDTTEVENGWHSIRATVYDGKDDGHDIIEVFVDNLPENRIPGIVIVEPDHGSTVNGTIVIWMLAWDHDGDDDIENVWVRIDGGPLRNATYNHTDRLGQWWYYEWDTTEVDDGWHDIRAIVYDGKDDNDDIIEVLVDNSPPEHEILNIDEGEILDGEIEIRIQTSNPDENVEIETMWIKIDDGEWKEANLVESEDGTSYWAYELDTKNLKNGEHHIYTSPNKGKDESEVEEITVLVDNPDKVSETPSPFPWAILVAIGTIIGLSLFALTEVGKFALLSLIFLPLYTKITKKDVLDHFIRGQIFGYIKVNPGDNYSTIKKNLDLNNGTLTYHLKVLEREGLVKSWNDGTHKYFYPQGVKIPGNGVKNPSIYEAILKSIKDSPGISVKDIAAVNGISSQLANYHVRKMAANGTIELERKSFSKVCYPKDS